MLDLCSTPAALSAKLELFLDIADLIAIDALGVPARFALKGPRARRGARFISTSPPL